MELIQIALFLAALVSAYLVYKVVKNIFVLALNSIIGFFALIGINTLLGTNVQINFWSVIITAIGGIFGFLFILIAHFMGWAF